jgi:two-component system, LytTR family, sensor kinase
MKLPLKILIHTIFWLVFLLFSFVVSYGSKPGAWNLIENITFHFALNIIWAILVFYLFYYYFIRFFERRQFVKYLVYSIQVSILVTFLFLPLHKIISPKVAIFNFNIFLPPVMGSFILAQCGCLVRGFENWFTDVQSKAELENRNLKNELELLKSQINPHFLFNTLNNIDSLIHTIPDNASDALITLSDMMRYMIYETKSDHVPLSKEIVYIRNYIKLQQLRFKDPEYIKVTLPDQCEGIRIAPLLLLPFIENAFKYSYNKGKFPVIEIALSCTSHRLTFLCKNYYKREKPRHERTGGVGLENVKRRLELLYPQKYDLNILEENNFFKIELIIQLA